MTPAAEVHAHRRAVDRKALLNTGAVPLEPNVPRAPVRVYDADTGDLALVVGRCPPEVHAPLRAALSGYKIGNDRITRAHGSGNNSKTFGFIAPAEAMRRYGCRPCESARTQPAVHAVVANAAGQLAALTRDLAPERAAADAEQAAAIAPEWRLPGSPWTSGVVNFTSPMAYHVDANNLPTWSAMLVSRRDVRGGHLHLPEYDLVLPCDDGDLVWFAGWDVAHAVTPMRVRRDGYRISAVYYTVARMRHCTDDELTRSREKRTVAETDWRQRQGKAGLLT